MIWPVCSFIVDLRSPLTATVDVTPSFAALPPNRFTIRPSMPANSTCDLLIGPHVGAERSDEAHRATAREGRARGPIRESSSLGMPERRFGFSGGWDCTLCRAARRDEPRAIGAHTRVSARETRRARTGSRRRAGPAEQAGTPRDVVEAVGDAERSDAGRRRRFGHVGERRRDDERERRRLQNVERDRRLEAPRPAEQRQHRTPSAARPIIVSRRPPQRSVEPSVERMQRPSTPTRATPKTRPIRAGPSPRCDDRNSGEHRLEHRDRRRRGDDGGGADGDRRDSRTHGARSAHVSVRRASAGRSSQTKAAAPSAPRAGDDEERQRACRRPRRASRRSTGRS